MAAGANPVTGAHMGPVTVPETPVELQREMLVANGRSFGWISNRVSSISEGKAPFWWWVLFIPSAMVMTSSHSMTS